MVTAVEAGDLDFVRSHDRDWTTVIPNPEYSRVDDLAGIDLHETEDDPTRRITTRDGLRILRAVYRLATIAWLLEGPGHPDVTRGRLNGARAMASHFRDPLMLTFVAGRAIEVASDRRMAWWKWMLQPAGDFRVVAMTFIPALITAYLSLLMDVLPDEPRDTQLELPAERWIEEYRTMLGDGMNRAWPLQTDPSYWTTRSEDEALAGQRDSIVRRKLTITDALDTSVAELERVRTIRIRRAPVKDDLRELFIVTAQQTWATYRAIGPVLRALGAPQPTTAPGFVSLVESTIPKAGFVGETSDVHVSTYGQELGMSAAGAEGDFLLGLIVQKLGPQRPTVSEVSAGIAMQVIEIIEALRESGYAPSLVIAPGYAAVWSRLQMDADREGLRHKLEQQGVPKHLLHYVQAGIKGLPVLASRGLTSSIIVIDAERGLAVPSSYSPDGRDLDVTVIEPDAAAVEQELAENPAVEQSAVGYQLEQRMQQLDVSAGAELAYKVVDPDAIKLVWL
jgi:hypothetical protein